MRIVAMSNPLRVTLIKQYILDHPSQQLEEIHAFAQELGASEEDIEEALLLVAHENSNENTPADPALAPLPQQSINQSSSLRSFTSKTFHAIPKKYLFSLLILIIISTGILLSLYRDTLLDPATPLADQIVQVAHIDKSLEALAPPVYANQTPMSADTIFSFPATEITLRYTGQPSREIVGFFPYWMLEREEDINVQGLTSVNLFGLETDGQGNIIVSRGSEADGGWEMWNSPNLNTFVNRMKNKKVKVLITIKAFDNGNIERLVASDDAQRRFIANAIQLVQSKSLDGINLDFEYVGVASEETRLEFVRLVANLHQELKRQHPEALLTADTYVTAGAHNDFFEISLLQESLDAFIIMGYDFHTPQGTIGPVAPLEGEYSLVGFLQSYLERVPAEKLILAVPYYGYAWPNNGAPGKAISYAELANMSKKLSIHWNSTTQTPYFSYKDTEDNLTYTAHYENARSLGLKYDYVLKKNFQGVAIWALGYDGLNQELQQVLLEKFSY